MYTYSSRFTLADGHFRLNPSPSRRAPDGPLWISQEIRACLSLELPPGQDALRHWLNRRFGGGFLLALLLHMLCFGLVMAHAYYSLDKPGVVSAVGGGDGASGGIIQLGLVGLSALNGAGEQAPPGQALQEGASIEQRMPFEPSVAEESASPVAVQKNVPATSTQATRSVRKRQSDAVRHTETAALTAVQGKTGTISGDKSAAQTSASAAVSVGSSGACITGEGAEASGSPGAGTARDSAEASGGLTVFGGSDGPSFKRFVQPEYPAQARRQGITGRVLLRIHINAEGVAEHMEVAESAHSLLSKAALKAAERSSFYPLKRNGKPVSCWTLLPVSFSLERG